MFILDIVQGYQLEFISHPSQLICRETFSSKSLAVHIDPEINKLEQKGVICKVSHDVDQFISTVVLTPKSDGTYRMIFNLKELN